MSDNKKYTVEDIRLYLEGKLSPSEMHAMEKAALEDPFLADALEGLQHFDNKEKFFEQVGELRGRLNERVRKRSKVLVLPLLWKIAAVLLIVVTGVAIIIYTGEKNETANSEIAKTERREVETKKTDTGKPAIVSDSAPPEQLKVQAVPRSPARAETKKVVQPPVAESLDVVSLQDETSAVEQASPATDTAIVQAEGQKAVAKSLDGRVAGVAIQKKKTERADTIDTESTNALNEVVVVGYGTSRRKAEKDLARNSLQKRIVPAGGWDAFENYINQNKSSLEVDFSKRGEQKISFVVDQNGRPSAMKILKSLSANHDRETIRLLNEGPAWEVVRGKKRRVTLSIIF